MKDTIGKHDAINDRLYYLWWNMFISPGSSPIITTIHKMSLLKKICFLNTKHIACISYRRTKQYINTYRRHDSDRSIFYKWWILLTFQTRRFLLGRQKFGTILILLPSICLWYFTSMPFIYNNRKTHWMTGSTLKWQISSNRQFYIKANNQNVPFL